MKRIIIFALIIGVLAIIGVWQYSFRSAKDSVKSLKTDVELTADKLLLDFETDENNANTLYLNKVLSVTGKVTEISNSETGYSVYLKSDDSMTGILCGFSKHSFETYSIEVGDIVVVKGLCTGFLFDVVLNKCVWAK